MAITFYQASNTYLLGNIYSRSLEVFFMVQTAEACRMDYAGYAQLSRYDIALQYSMKETQYMFPTVIQEAELCII